MPWRDDRSLSHSLLAPLKHFPARVRPQKPISFGQRVLFRSCGVHEFVLGRRRLRRLYTQNPHFTFIFRSSSSPPKRTVSLPKGALIGGRPKTNLLLWHHFKVDPAQATGTGPAGGRAIDQVGERRGGLAGCWARRCEAKGLGVGRTRSAAPGGSLTDQGEFHRNEGWRGFAVLREGCSRAREGHEKKKKQEQQPQRAKLESAFPALSAGGEAERPMVDPAPQPLANGASRELLLTFSLLSLSSFPCLRSKRTRSFFRPRPTTTHACRLAHVTRRRRRSDVRVCERGRAAHHGRVIR